MSFQPEMVDYAQKEEICVTGQKNIRGKQLENNRTNIFRSSAERGKKNN